MLSCSSTTGSAQLELDRQTDSRGGCARARVFISQTTHVDCLNLIILFSWGAALLWSNKNFRSILGPAPQHTPTRPSSRECSTKWSKILLDQRRLGFGRCTHVPPSNFGVANWNKSTPNYRLNERPAYVVGKLKTLCEEFSINLLIKPSFWGNIFRASSY